MQNYSMLDGMSHNSTQSAAPTDFDPLLMKDICSSCPRFLYFLNSCPMVAGVRTNRLQDFHLQGYSSHILDYLMVTSSVLNFLALLSVWITLVTKKTTRSFCMAACQFISFLAVNHMSKAYEDPRPEGSCTPGDFGMPSLSSTLCGSMAMWLLLESFQLPKTALFKQGLQYVLTRTIYLGFSPIILVSRFYLRYNFPIQVFTSYSIGSVVSTAVFIFVKSTTLTSESIKTGLFPLWARLGLKNNLSVGYLGQSSREDYLKYIKLKKQAQPLRDACEHMENKYHALKLATKSLFDSNKDSGLLSELLKNKDAAAQYMTPEFEAELQDQIDLATRNREIPKTAFTQKGQFTDPDLVDLTKSVYDFMNTN